MLLTTVINNIYIKKTTFDNRSYLNHNQFQNILDESFAIIIGLFHCPKSFPTFQNALLTGNCFDIQFRNKKTYSMIKYFQNINFTKY